LILFAKILDDDPAPLGFAVSTSGRRIPTLVFLTSRRAPQYNVTPMNGTTKEFYSDSLTIGAVAQ
jgi:hypothetical protein